MSLYRDEAVVLRSIRLGEADRIVTLVTPRHGKVRAVAKGVRRTKSRFGGRLEPLSHVSVLCWKGRELDIVTQAEVLDHFRAVREDLERLSAASAMLEVVDQVAQEGQPGPELYKMLVGALRTLAIGPGSSPGPGPVPPAPPVPPPVLIVPAFFWKVLVLDGSAPVLYACARCGEAADLIAFDLGEGGVLCRSCRRGVAVSPDALGLVRRIVGGDLAAVLAEPASTATDEVARLATEAIQTHLERRLRCTPATY